MRTKKGFAHDRGESFTNFLFLQFCFMSIDYIHFGLSKKNKTQEERKQEER